MPDDWQRRCVFNPRADEAGARATCALRWSARRRSVRRGRPTMQDRTWRHTKAEIAALRDARTTAGTRIGRGPSATRRARIAAASLRRCRRLAARAPVRLRRVGPISTQPRTPPRTHPVPGDVLLPVRTHHRAPCSPRAHGDHHPPRHRRRHPRHDPRRRRREWASASFRTQSPCGTARTDRIAGSRAGNKGSGHWRCYPSRSSAGIDVYAYAARYDVPPCPSTSASGSCTATTLAHPRRVVAARRAHRRRSGRVWLRRYHPRCIVSCSRGCPTRGCTGSPVRSAPLARPMGAARGARIAGGHMASPDRLPGAHPRTLQPRPPARTARGTTTQESARAYGIRYMDALVRAENAAKGTDHGDLRDLHPQRVQRIAGQVKSSPADAGCHAPPSFRGFVEAESTPTGVIPPRIGQSRGIGRCRGVTTLARC